MNQICHPASFLLHLSHHLLWGLWRPGVEQMPIWGSKAIHLLPLNFSFIHFNFNYWLYFLWVQLENKELNRGLIDGDWASLNDCPMEYSSNKMVVVILAPELAGRKGEVPQMFLHLKLCKGDFYWRMAHYTPIKSLSNILLSLNWYIQNLVNSCKVTEMF